MIGVKLAIFLLFICLISSHAFAVENGLAMTLDQAEKMSLDTSYQLKATASAISAADEVASAQYTGLLPRLTLDGMFQYNTHVPTVQLPIPGVPAIQFGSNYIYSFGPTISYMLWDSGSARDSFKGYGLLAQSRREDQKSASLSTLLSLRISYLRLQLSLEELHLLASSLQLSQAQNHDIETNFRAGAATKLDLVDSGRDVINYRLQFEQKQSEVSSNLTDLLALVQAPEPRDFKAPGPPGVTGVSFPIQLDSLEQDLAATSAWQAKVPTDQQPMLKSQILAAESSRRLADSQRSGLYPTLKISASALIEYPDQLNLNQVEQNIFLAVVSMPLYEGGRTQHLTESLRQQAQVAQFNEQNTRINLMRDYQKCADLLASLRSQQKLAELDVQRSEEAARLYYQSYKGGKLNLIDVQTANNKSLVSKVNHARINAQILTQIYTLRSISGEEPNHGI